MKPSFRRVASALFAVAVAGFAITGIAISGVAVAIGQDKAAPAAPAAKVEVVVPFIGNATCPTQAGKKVNPTKYVEFEKQRVYYCCGKCQGAAKADPKAAVAAAYKETKPAGNKKCPVSGHEIEAGKAKSVAFMGHSIDLCCADCEKAFNADAYAMTICAVYGCEDLKNAKCPVMDEEAYAEDSVIYQGKLVRLCCADCPAEFKKDAEKLLAKASAK
ncbi:MAG: hypothetical protein EXS13_02795 [Planctomycetes bacterium]|nr:hypothetical protein [Planctomycetota bacterium]